MNKSEYFRTLVAALALIACVPSMAEDDPANAQGPDKRGRRCSAWPCGQVVNATRIKG